jgi:hypothetical protein
MVVSQKAIMIRLYIPLKTLLGVNSKKIKVKVFKTRPNSTFEVPIKYCTLLLIHWKLMLLDIFFLTWHIKICICWNKRKYSYQLIFSSLCINYHSCQQVSFDWDGHIIHQPCSCCDSLHDLLTPLHDYSEKCKHCMIC